MATSPPSITALPTPPDPNDRSTFNARAYPWSVAQQTLATEVGAVADNVFDNATEAAADASTATTQAGLAATSKTNADAAAALANNWATKTDGPVAGGEYSAKYYAQIAEGAVATIPEGTINDATTSLTSTWSSSKTSTELSAKVNATGGTASGLTLTNGYTEEVFSVTSTTPALSPANGSIQTWTLSGNSTPTAGTWAAGQSMTLMVNDGTAFTITWTSLGITWVGGTAPALATSGFTVIVLWKVGSTIYGVKSGEVA